jgi:hypothetical protein
LEEERRRELEEERKRLEEERRKRRIAEEAERIEIIKRFREAALTLKVASGELNTKNEAQPQTDTNGSANKDLTIVIKEIIQIIRRHLESIPPEWSKIFHAELGKIRQAVADTERNHCDPYFFHQLKWAQRNLIWLIADAHKKIDALDQALHDIDGLIIQMEIVEKNDIVEENRRNARLLKETLNELARNVDPSFIIARLPALKNKAGQLYVDFEETRAREKTRSFVFQNTLEVLVEMGYEVLGTEVPQGNIKPAYLMLKTPDSEVARMGFGLDNSIFAEFAHLVSENNKDCVIPREELIAKCRRWCKDYSLLQKKLVEREISLSDKWFTLPEEGRYEEIYVKCLDQGIYDGEMTEEEYLLHNIGRGEKAHAKK